MDNEIANKIIDQFKEFFQMYQQEMKILAHNAKRLSEAHQSLAGEVTSAFSLVEEDIQALAQRIAYLESHVSPNSQLLDKQLH